MMRKISILLVLLQFSVLALLAAETPKECALCVGAAADLTPPPAAVLPLLLQVSENDLATTQIDAFSPAQRAKVTVLVSYSIDKDKDPLLDAETHTKNIIEWARLHGPFEGIGVSRK